MNEPVSAVPRQLHLARMLWLASVLLGAARTVFRLADRQSLVDELRQRAPELSLAQVDTAANAGVMVTLLVVAAMFGLYLWLTSRMVSGASWARTVLTVLGGVGIALGITGLVGLNSGAAAALTLRVGPLDIGLSVVSLGLDIAAMVFMLHPAVNAYFARQRAAQRR